MVFLGRGKLLIRNAKLFCLQRQNAVGPYAEAKIYLGLQIKFLELFGEISEHLGCWERIELLVLPLQVLYLPGRELVRGGEQSHLRKNKTRL